MHFRNVFFLFENLLVLSFITETRLENPHFAYEKKNNNKQQVIIPQLSRDATHMSSVYVLVFAVESAGFAAVVCSSQWYCGDCGQRGDHPD